MATGNKWVIYERRKREIQVLGLYPREYELAIWRLCRVLKI